MKQNETQMKLDFCYQKRKKSLLDELLEQNLKKSVLGDVLEQKHKISL